MPKLTINPYSDDVIGYSFGKRAEDMGEPEATFRLKVPGLCKLAVVCAYGDAGWEFSVKLPANTQLIGIDRWSDQFSDEDDE